MTDFLEASLAARGTGIEMSNEREREEGGREERKGSEESERDLGKEVACGLSSRWVDQLAVV